MLLQLARFIIASLCSLGCWPAFDLRLLTPGPRPAAALAPSCTPARRSDGVSVRVQSVGALCAAINFSTIALSNIYLMAVGKMPLAIPRETVVTITGVALVAGGLCLAGWVIGGSVLPNRRALVPKGKAKWPLLIGIAGLSACAIACSFYPRQLAEVINPGVLDSLPGATTATLGAKQGVKDFFENVQGAAASSFGGKKGVKDAVEGMQGAAANSLGSKKGVKDVMDNLPSAPNALHGVKKSVKDAYDNLPSASTTFHGAKKGADELLAPIGELSGPVPMIVMMILHAGRAMGLVILGTLAICSVGDEEVSYRLLRCWCLSCAFRSARHRCTCQPIDRLPLQIPTPARAPPSPRPLVSYRLPPPLPPLAAASACWPRTTFS